MPIASGWVALPGERVIVDPQGRLQINGEPLPKPYIERSCDDIPNCCVGSSLVYVDSPISVYQLTQDGSHTGLQNVHSNHAMWVTNGHCGNTWNIHLRLGIY